MKLKSIGKNQNEVEINETTTVFFSYSTPVAAYVEESGNSINNRIYYRTEKHWSTTTSRHINAWLDGANAETKPQGWFDSLTA